MSEPRLLLLARLAAERARLLHTLIGLDAATLAERSVVEDWTATAILAHIGDYDRLFAARLALILGGRANEIEDLGDLDRRNAELHAQIKNWSLGKALDQLEEARTALLGSLSWLSDEALHQQQRLPWGRARINTWMMWRAHHDAGHTRDLQQWRRTLPRDAKPGPKVLMMAALRAARADWLASAALVPADVQALRPVCGFWTLKDVFGHLADCDDCYLGVLRQMQGGPPYDLEDEETFNERRYLVRCDYSWEQNWRDAQAARDALLSALDALSQEEWEAPHDNAVQPYPTIYHCAWSALEHYLDHTAVLRAALGLAMPKRLLQFRGPYT